MEDIIQEINIEPKPLKTSSLDDVPSVINWNKIFGIFLLIPPITSVPLFFFQFINRDILTDFLGSPWTGKVITLENGGGGYSSSLPIYFGLMAIGGSILLSFGNKKSNI